MDFNNLERKTKVELFELIQSKQEEVNKLQKEIDAMKSNIDLVLTQISNHYHSCVARKNLKQMSASISEISEIEVHELSMQTLERILKGE